MTKPREETREDLTAEIVDDILHMLNQPAQLRFRDVLGIRRIALTKAICRLSGIWNAHLLEQGNELLALKNQAMIRADKLRPADRACGLMPLLQQRGVELL